MLGNNQSGVWGMGSFVEPLEILAEALYCMVEPCGPQGRRVELQRISLKRWDGSAKAESHSTPTKGLTFATSPHRATNDTERFPGWTTPHLRRLVAWLVGWLAGWLANCIIVLHFPWFSLVKLTKRIRIKIVEFLF